MCVRGATDNYDATSPFVTLSDKVEIIEPEEIMGEELVEGEEEQWTGSLSLIHISEPTRPY